MSTDGENAKNQTFEVEDTKPNLDSTDSSQESAPEVLDKSDDKDAVNDKKSEDDDLDKKEKSEKSSDDEKPAEKEKAAVNDSVKEEEERIDAKNEDNDEEKINDKDAKEDKNEEKTDDDTEGGEDAEEGSAEEEEEEDDDKKDVPLLDQPLEKSGPRERKKVQRFNEEFTAEQKEGAKVELSDGNGVSLGEIPRIDASISRFKTEDLKLLHRLLFKIPGKTVQIKKNIRKFNGFDFEKDSDAYTKKVASTQKFEMKQLKSICEMLDLDKKGTKEELADRICEFLLEPKDSGKPPGGGRPKRSAATRANNRGYSSAEDDDDSDDGKRSSRSTRGKGRRVNLKDETSSEEEFDPTDSEDEEERTPRVKRGRGRSSVGVKKKPETDEEISDVEETLSDEDSDEPKSKKKRGPVAKVQNNKATKKPVVAVVAAASPRSARGAGRKSANSTPVKTKKAETPAKRGRKKKPQPESEEDEEKDSEENNAGSSSEDEPLVKKSKSPQPPTDEEIKTYVKEILEGANLEEITMKTVCKQVYAHYPEFDLAHKKDFIKTTVKSLIST